LRRRTALFVAPLAAIALIGAGCGGGDSTTGNSGNTTDNSTGGSTDPVAILNAIQVPTTATEPTKVVFKVNADLKGTISNAQAAAFLGDGPISVELSGPTDPAKKAADLAFTLKAGKLDFAGNLRVLDGKTGYIQLKDKWYALPADSLNSSSSTSPADIDKVTEALKSVKPANLIKNPEYKGTEDIEGRSTNHVSGDVDTQGLVTTIADIAKSQNESVSESEIQEAQTKIDQYVKNAKVDVWVDQETNEVRRLQLKGDFVTDSEMKSESGLDGATIDITVQGTPTDSPDISAPSGALSSQQLQTDLTGILLQSLGG